MEDDGFYRAVQCAGGVEGAVFGAAFGWDAAGVSQFVQSSDVEADNDAIAKAATATGELFVASSMLRGQPMIRLAIGNAQTTEDDIRRSWEVLRACVQRQ